MNVIAVGYGHSSNKKSYHKSNCKRYEKTPLDYKCYGCFLLDICRSYLGKKNNFLSDDRSR